MRALSSVKSAAEHAHFMKWVIAESTDTIPPAESVSVYTRSVCLSVCQESQHPGVLPAGRGSRRAAHVVALQRQPHRHAGQHAGACS